VRSGPLKSPADDRRAELDVLRVWLTGYHALRQILIRALRPTGLTPEAWMILEAVAERSRSACELGPMLGMQKGSLSRWLTHLATAGLLTHLYELDSRRRKTVTLTEAGQRQRRLARARLGDALTPPGRSTATAEREAVDALIRQFARRPPGSMRGAVVEPPDQGNRR